MSQTMQPTQKGMSQEPPLCVDLDGTLIRTDLLVESLFAALRANPLVLVLFPFWLLKGRSYAKQRLASLVHITVENLPYCQSVLEEIKAQKVQGRTIWLATASNQAFAQQVADHLGVFDRVLGSTPELNLKSHHKARVLTEETQGTGFDYIGDAKADKPVWAAARKAYAVSPSGGIKRWLKQTGKLEKTFAEPHQFRGILRAMRPHQWAKNSLLLVPLLAAHHWYDVDAWMRIGLGFFAFGLVASSVYLLNDLLDLEADRSHPRKRFRPFASGQASLFTGLAFIPLLLVGGFALTWTVPGLMWVLGGYYLTTLGYSLGLKRVMLLDVAILATLFTLRVLAGAVAAQVHLSYWLLAFSAFIFLALALLKRYAELKTMEEQGKDKAAGRGYSVSDMPIIRSLGTASSYVSVMVLALYINSGVVKSLYHWPEAIWALCLLLIIWLSRAWLLANRGQMHDDPVVFAIKDPVSLMIAALVVFNVWVAL